MLIASSSSPMDSLIGSLVIAPVSAIRALCKIFCVLVNVIMDQPHCLDERRVDPLIENATAKHGKTTVQRHGFRNSETTHTQRKSQWSESAQRHDRNAGEEWSTHVQIRVVLGCCPYVR